MSQQSNFAFYDYHPKMADVEKVVLEGLTENSNKSLPSWLLYDAKGSELFLQICETKEYYPTRTEMKLIEDYGAEISEYIGPNSTLIEPGACNPTKARALLSHLENVEAYVPVDISRSHLLESMKPFAERSPAMKVVAVCADFVSGMELPKLPGRKIIFFPGSTIGNFDATQRQQVLESFSSIVGTNGGVLIGADLKKSPELLEAAYNDSQGVTEQFEKNVLVRLNRELGANFSVDDFEYDGIYNEEKGRIEMSLRSCSDQTVQLNGTKVHFEEGESIQLERSYKWTLEEFTEMCETAGFRVEKSWVDDSRLYSLNYLVPKQPKLAN